MTPETCPNCGRPTARSLSQWIDASNTEEGPSRFCGDHLGRRAPAVECRDVRISRLRSELEAKEVELAETRSALKHARDWLLLIQRGGLDPQRVATDAIESLDAIERGKDGTDG